MSGVVLDASTAPPAATAIEVAAFTWSGISHIPTASYSPNER